MKNHNFKENLINSDASFANDLHTKYNFQDYAFKFIGNLIDWKTDKQKTITFLFTKTELLIIFQTNKKFLWWSRLFNMLKFDSNQQISIQCDNQQTIKTFTSNNLRFTTKMKHVDIHVHWLRQKNC